MIPVTVVHQIPGSRSVELGTVTADVRFATAAVGGFADATVTLPGDLRKQLGYLGMVRLYNGSTLLWEGQLEDQNWKFDATTITTTFTAFGLKRKLEETSVRRIWSKRDLNHAEYPAGLGGMQGNGAFKGDIEVIIGSFLPSDLSKQGVGFAGKGVAVAAARQGASLIIAPTGLTITRLLADVVLSGANTGPAKMVMNIASSTDGVSWTGTDYTASGSVNHVPTAGTTQIQIAFDNVSGGSLTPTATDVLQVSNIRLLGTSLAEDAAGGFYGGTILRDLLALVAGLTAGQIDDGSDYTIQAIDRAVRDTALSALQEVAGYYTREWAVWEGGRLDWKTKNLDEPQWTVKVAECDEFDIQTTLDGVAKTVYVLYTDAASGLEAEASAAATDPRNPYVRQAITKDVLVNPGFPMTSNTSAQLAARVAGDIGARPSASGRCVIKANRLISNVVGEPLPAALIRGGDNISLPELPKSDPFLTGRDGETLFHVASTEVDLSANTVTLTLEGQQARTDVILARLAASTRILTG